MESICTYAHSHFSISAEEHPQANADCSPFPTSLFP